MSDRDVKVVVLHLQNKHPCPTCGRLLDVSWSLHEGNEPPEPGCYTFCSKCGEPAVFTAEMQLRKFGPYDWVEAMQMPEFVQGNADMLARRQNYRGKNKDH